jgi:hypothetical protein
MSISFGNDGTYDLTGIAYSSRNFSALNLDISGDIDVDGTTNLDVVDVDGAVNFAADVTFADGAESSPLQQELQTSEQGSTQVTLLKAVVIIILS